LPFPLAPLNEQRRIVSEIEKQFSRLDEAVANLKRVKANLKRYKAAVLKAAVEGKLTEAWRKQHPDVEPASKLLERILAERRAKWNGKGQYNQLGEPKTSDLPELPSKWIWARLDAIAALKGGITVDKNRKSSTARAVPYLRVANVQRGYLDFTEIKTIEAPDAEIKDLRLRPGDILFNEGGDRDKLGRGWLWEGQLPECIHQNHVFRARLFLAEVSPKLVSWWGNSFGQAYFLREGKQTTNLASLNLSKLSAFPIPLPPVAEQLQIVAEVERRLSLIEELEAAVEANLIRAERLRQSILKRAFEGKLIPTKQPQRSDSHHELPLAAKSSSPYGVTR
jgi:type I restriction enzyme, S subunit